MSELFKSMLKTELYECLERKGKKLPSINSSLVTKQWLIRVFNEEEYCPNYIDVKLRPCPVKPLKQCFVEEIRKILDYNQITLTIDERHSPDLEWCALVLSTLDPDHRFFQKEYYPSDFEKGKSQYRNENSNIEENLVSQKEANLLQGLPSQIFKKSKILSKNQVITVKQQRNIKNIIDESLDNIEPQNKECKKFKFTPSQQNNEIQFNTVFNQNSDTKIKSGTATIGNKIRPLILPKSEQKNINNQIDFSSNVSMQTQSNQVMFSQN